MSIEIRLPHLGDDIESGDILNVLVNEGDEITKDQGIVEVETDKATVEVPSVAAGRVVKIHVSPGQTVAVGQPLVTLEGVAGGTETADAPSPESTTTSPPAEMPATEASTSPPAPSSPSDPPSHPAAADKTPRRPAATDASGTGTAVSGPPGPAAVADAAEPERDSNRPAPRARKSTTVPAGPAVRRFAREVGVELESVPGSGPGGRITRDDVVQVVRQASKVARSGAVAASPSDADQVPGTRFRDPWGAVSLEPLTKIRKTIAAKMHQSWSTVPRVTNFDDADVTELEKIRQASKADYASAGIKLTAMPFVIKAVSMALRNHPIVNATLDLENNQIVYKRYIHMGIAVDTDRGLLVPALRDADRRSIADTARELAALAEKVRDNDFTVEDLRGTTFSISNLGAIGGTYSTPIINVPEVAILLVGRSRKMPVVVDDDVAVRLMMPLSLSYDHRLIDGATAARFLNDVIGYLQAPGRLLLAP